ncbi:MAG TPA: phasin family protein [Rhodopila sp.]|nr:phasin family protein [Rhodopila sp.]
MINSSVDFAAIGKDNLEAFAASGKIWAAGVQDLTKQFAATAKASFEDSLATFKALSGVKSVKEAVELQSNYGKAAVTKALSETSKLTEASLKLTEQALAPITARMAATVEAFTKTA